MTRYPELGDFVAMIPPGRTTAFSFINPEVHVEHDHFDDVDGVCILWAQLSMSPADDPEVRVGVGHADLMTVAVSDDVDDPETILGQLDLEGLQGLAPSDGQPGPLHPIWYEPALDRCNPANTYFDLDDGVQEVTVVRDVFIDPAFRGHKLGTWMLAHLGSRSDQAGDVLLGTPRETSSQAATDAPTPATVRYWVEQLGVDGIAMGCLGGLRGAEGFTKAESRIGKSLAKSPISVDPAELTARFDDDDPLLWPRTTGTMPEVIVGGAYEDDDDQEAPPFLIGASRVLDSIDEDDPDNGMVHAAVALRSTAVVTFTSPDQGQLLARAARYICDNPDFVITDLRWSHVEDFESEEIDGILQVHRLELTVIAPPDERIPENLCPTMPYGTGDDALEPMDVDDELVARLSDQFESIIAEATEWDLERRGAWQTDRVQILHQRLLSNRSGDSARLTINHLALLLGIAIDHIVEDKREK